MSWMRTGILISLTLVASSLPAQSSMTPAVSLRSQTSDVPAEPTKSHSNRPHSNDAVLDVAPTNTDMWTGPTVRLEPNPGSSAHTIGLLPTSWEHSVPTLAVGRFICLVDHSALPTQSHAWLIDRYPQPPPHVA